MNMPGGNEKIFLIDDEEAILKTNTLLLTKLGYEVHSAASGNEAVEKIIALPEKPDLIVSDYHLPDINGIELINKINETGYNGKFVIISGESIDNASLPDSVAGSIMKPFRLQFLAEQVREYLDS